MLDQISPYVSINEDTIWQESRVLQDHIGELNEELRKYNELVAVEKEAAEKRGWGQWAGRALSSAANTAMHPLTKTKKPNTLRRDFGWGTGTIIDSYTLMYGLNGSKPRTPGAYAVDDEPSTQGATNEQIHPTVGYRVAMTKDLPEEKLWYRPAGLTPDKYQRRKRAGGGWEYVLGDVTLPEYKIKPRSEMYMEQSFERHTCGMGDWKKTKPYMKEVDEGNGFAVAEFP